MKMRYLSEGGERHVTLKDISIIIKQWKLNV